MIIRKKLDEKHTLITTPHYPYMRKHKQNRRHKVVLGLGGNIGDVQRRFEHLYWYLKHSRSIEIVETTPILKNPAFGFMRQREYLNTLMRIETDMTPRALLTYVLHVEKKFKRKRFFKDGPRTLDIDIIFYDKIKMQTKDLTIPHKEWKNRNSVVIPLSYMKGKI